MPVGDSSVLDAIRNGLVVSCQAPPGHPLHDSRTIAALARCAELGGACGTRVEGPEDIKAVKAATGLPVIGLKKAYGQGARPLITVSYEDCEIIAAAGADMIALEATRECHKAASEVQELIDAVHKRLKLPVMADVSSFDEGLDAWCAGADAVSTTLTGHTSGTRSAARPALDLVSRLAAAGTRVVLEGWVDQPGQVAAAFAGGAWSVVIGSAITDPLERTRLFSTSTPRGAAAPPA